MKIEIDPELLYTEFESTKINQGAIYIFYTSNRKDSFIYFDFFKESIDQMAMIHLGVCLKTEDKRL